MALEKMDKEMIEKLEHLGALINQGLYQQAYQLMKELLDVDQSQPEQPTQANGLPMVFRDVFTRLDEMKKGQGAAGRTIPANWAGLDKLIGGWEKGAIAIIAGRPGARRFDFLLQAALNVMSENIAVAFISTSLDRPQFNDRLVALLTNLPDRCFCSGTFDENEFKILEERAGNACSLSFYSEVLRDFECSGLIEKIENMIRYQKVNMIVIDDLQRFYVRDQQSRTRSAELAFIVESLDALARKYQVAILSGSRVDRSSELKPGDKRPLLAEISESSDIEELADKVLFIFRMDLYGVLEDEEGENIVNSPTIILSRNKTGPLGELRMIYDPHRRLFMEYLRT